MWLGQVVATDYWARLCIVMQQTHGLLWLKKRKFLSVSCGWHPTPWTHNYVKRCDIHYKSFKLKAYLLGSRGLGFPNSRYFHISQGFQFLLIVILIAEYWVAAGNGGQQTRISLRLAPCTSTPGAAWAIDRSYAVWAHHYQGRNIFVRVQTLSPIYCCLACKKERNGKLVCLPALAWIVEFLCPQATALIKRSNHS